MWVWGYDESAERERGFVRYNHDTTIGIEFEYPERTNGWRTDAHCVFGRPAASCYTLGNWIDRRIWKSSAWCFNSEKIHDVTQFVMMGKMLSQSVELDIYGWDTVELFCLNIFVDLNLLQLKNLTCIPRKSNPLMFAASSGRSRTVDTALKAISELFSKYEDEDQQWEGTLS